MLRPLRLFALEFISRHPRTRFLLQKDKTRAPTYFQDDRESADGGRAYLTSAK